MTVILDVKVIANSEFSKFALDKRGYLLIYVKSAPEKGKANKELVKVLAKRLEIPQVNIDIIKGLTSRYKKIKIESSFDKIKILSKLGLDVQKSII